MQAYAIKENENEKENEKENENVNENVNEKEKDMGAFRRKATRE